MVPDRLSIIWACNKPYMVASKLDWPTNKSLAINLIDNLARDTT